MEEDSKNIPKINPGVIENISEGIQDWCKKALGMILFVESPYGPKFSDNDWMLILKLHAMIETALNAAIVTRLGTPELYDIIPRFETGNTKSGKAKIAKELQLISHTEMVFIQKLSEIRNKCAHDTRNFGFDLKKYLEEPDPKDERKAFLKAVSKAKDSSQITFPPYPGLPISIQQDLVYIGTGIIAMLAIHNRAWEIRWKDHKWPPTAVVFPSSSNQSSPTE